MSAPAGRLGENSWGINLLVIVNIYLGVIRFRPDVFEWFLSTLFDASLLELKAAFYAAFFCPAGPLAPNLLVHSQENLRRHLDLGRRLNMIGEGAKI